MQKKVLNSELKFWPFAVGGLFFGPIISVLTVPQATTNPVVILVASLIAGTLFAFGVYYQTKKIKQNVIRTTPPKDITEEILAEGEVGWALSSENSGALSLKRSPGYAYCTKSEIIYLPGAQMSFQKTFKAKKDDIVEIIRPNSKELRIRFQDGQVTSFKTEFADDWLKALKTG